MLKVAVHCGSGYVKGKARNFPYYVASLFIPRKKKNGAWIYVNSGIHTYPRRSSTLCYEDAEKLAKEYPMCSVIHGYGSLHNTPA